MVLKFHMRHNQSTGLQYEKIQPAHVFHQNHLVHLAEIFCMAHYWDLGFQYYQNKNKMKQH